MRLRQIKLVILDYMIIMLLLVFSTMGAQARETETPIPQTLACYAGGDPQVRHTDPEHGSFRRRRCCDALHLNHERIRLRRTP